MSATPKTDARLQAEAIIVLLCQLDRENAALREDKERLDWLTTQNRVDYSISYWRKTDTKTLRAALDAARKEAKP